MNGSSFPKGGAMSPPFLFDVPTLMEETKIDD
jgi:hypothetical protein